MHTVFGKDPSGNKKTKRKRKDDEPLIVGKGSLFFQAAILGELVAASQLRRHAHRKKCM